MAANPLELPFLAVGDPVGTGLVPSLARPAGNATGVSQFGPQLSGKRLELLKDSLPAVMRVAVLRDPTSAGHVPTFRETELAAQTLGIELQPVDARTDDDLDRAFQAAMSKGSDALITLPSPIYSEARTRIVELAARSRLPALYDYRAYVDIGGLMAYGANIVDVFRRGVAYADKLLKGSRPADLPIEQPMTFDFVINIRTAQALGLTIPQHVLIQATEIIQ